MTNTLTRKEARVRFLALTPLGFSKATEYFSAKEDRWYVRWRDDYNGKLRCAARARYNWVREYGPIPQGYQVHHVNGDRHDDRVANLELIATKAHVKLHQEEAR